MRAARTKRDMWSPITLTRLFVAYVIFCITMAMVRNMLRKIRYWYRRLRQRLLGRLLFKYSHERQALLVRMAVLELYSTRAEGEKCVGCWDALAEFKHDGNTIYCRNCFEQSLLDCLPSDVRIYDEAG